MTLGKTLAFKLALRDAGGQPGDGRTPSHLARQPTVPNPHGLLQLLSRKLTLLRKPTGRIEGGCQ
jgi:hypothetical protein